MSETVTGPAEVPAEVPSEEPVEPVDDDPDEEAEGVDAEAAPSPEQQGAELVIGMSERELEEVQKKLERSATTWRNRVSELLGEAAQMLVPCELCDPNIPGFHWPADVEQPRDETHHRILEVLRTPGEPEYEDDPNTVKCPVCSGKGKTKTRGDVPGKTLRVCKRCAGQGYLASDGPDLPQTNGAAEPDTYELPNEAPLVTEDTDVWGSPKLLPDGMENPNYGKMPQYKNPTLP